MTFVAVILQGARKVLHRDSMIASRPPSSISLLVLGSWILLIGWFGFNEMIAQKIGDISGLVEINTFMALAGGTIAALITSRMFRFCPE